MVEWWVKRMQSRRDVTVIMKNYKMHKVIELLRLLQLKKKME